MADEQITSSTANIPYINFINVGSDQAAPSAGRAVLYIKSGVAYVRLDTGDPVPVGGAVSLAEGQLAVGDAGGTLSALALGTEGDVVTADASGHASWASPAAPGGGGDFTLVERITVGVGGAANITFSTMPAANADLLLIGQLRFEVGTHPQSIWLRVNGVSTGVYSYSLKEWAGDVGSATTYANTSQNQAVVGRTFALASPGIYATSIRIHLPNFAGTTLQKTGLTEWEIVSDSSNSYSKGGRGGFSYNSSNAITSIALLPSEAIDVAEGSTVALYAMG